MIIFKCYYNREPETFISGFPMAQIEVKELSLKGLKLITPLLFSDDRGYFFESWREGDYRAQGIDCPFVQDNHSSSSKGTLRGMHFQSEPGQAKLVRVIEGCIFDAAVDIRPDSPTFGKWEGVILDSEKHEQLFVPVGFAHGFLVLSQRAQVLYKVSTVYNPETETGFIWNDPDIGIEWPVENPLVSKRDMEGPTFREMFLQDLR